MVLEFVTFWLVVVYFVYVLSRILPRKKPNLPPGPKSWPVIGNINLIGALPHRSLHELSKKYGPLMQLQFGSYPAVVGSNMEMAKIILKTMDKNFASRPKAAIGKYTGYNYRNITWSPQDAYWKHARKICFLELFSAKKLESYEYIRKEEMNTLIKEVFKSSGTPVVLKDYLSTFSSNVTCRMILGKNYLDGTDNAVPLPLEFRKTLNELFVLSAVFNIGDFIPCVDFLDLQGYVKQMRVVSKKLDEFLEHVVNEHEERRKESENYLSRDFVHVLLEQAENSSLDVKLDRNGVKAFTQDLLAGGTESSTVIVEWAISELLLKPELFNKATEELDRVLGQNEWVTEEIISKLPYIDAIVKETMRLHSLAPMISRLAEQDCTVAGYDIKKGTHVMVNVWTIGRDPSLWKNPDEFCPDRFVGRDIDVKGQDFEFLPFGSGRRMCPGYNMGMKMVMLSLANLLHGFNWRLPRNMKPKDLNMEELFALSTPKKIPLCVVAEPRLSIELYSF